MSHLNNEAAQLLQPSMRTVSPERGNIQDPAPCAPCRCLISWSSSCPRQRTIVKVLDGKADAREVIISLADASEASDNKYAGYNTYISSSVRYCSISAALLSRWSVYWNGSYTIKVFIPFSCVASAWEVQEPGAGLCWYCWKLTGDAGPQVIICYYGFRLDHK